MDELMRALAAFERHALSYVLIGGDRPGLHGVIRATEAPKAWRPGVMKFRSIEEAQSARAGSRPLPHPEVYP